MPTFSDHQRANARHHVRSHGEQITYLPRGIGAQRRALWVIVDRPQPQNAERGRQLVWSITFEDDPDRGVATFRERDRALIPRVPGSKDIVRLRFLRIIRDEGEGLITTEFQA